MSVELAEPAHETKPRRRRPQIEPTDGQKALTLCLQTLHALNKEWREWVITCIVNCPAPAVQQELPFNDDTELHDDKDDQ